MYYYYYYYYYYIRRGEKSKEGRGETERHEEGRGEEREEQDTAALILVVIKPEGTKYSRYYYCMFPVNAPSISYNVTHHMNS
jgi:hypothetical protein